jgi:hypothetical protein
MNGTKYDDDKLKFSLLPVDPIIEVVRVLMFGAAKYGAHNWIGVQNAKNRYFDATMRHMFAWRQGEMRDSESGLHHLGHAACCVLFLLWFELRDESPK